MWQCAIFFSLAQWHNGSMAQINGSSECGLNEENFKIQDPILRSIFFKDKKFCCDDYPKENAQTTILKKRYKI